MTVRPPIDRPPTKRQLAVLEFIYEHVAERGYPPSHRDICDHFEWASTVAARGHLLALESRGLIKRALGVSRGIRITEKGLELCQV